MIKFDLGILGYKTHFIQGFCINAVCKGQKNMLEFDSISTCTYGFLEHQEERYMLRLKALPREVCDYFGVLLKSDKEASGCPTSYRGFA